MFYVIGENDCQHSAIGNGETIEAAIADWAHSINSLDVVNEFNKYSPSVIRGERLTIQIEPEIKYSISIVET